MELIHELDYVTWIFGNPQKRTVELREVPELNITAPAEAHYELTYPDFSATIDLSYASKTRERFLEVIFTDGSQTRVEVITSDDLYTAQLQHVLACIAGKETSIHTAEDALQTLKLALPEA